MELNDEVQQILQQLGVHIHQLVTSDPEIKRLCQEVRSHHFNIALGINTSIGLSDMDSPPMTPSELGLDDLPDDADSGIPHFPPMLRAAPNLQKTKDLKANETATFSQKDSSFLRDLGITL